MEFRLALEQFKKFIAVSFFGTVICYAVFFLLFKNFGFGYVPALVVGYVAGVVGVCVAYPGGSLLMRLKNRESKYLIYGIVSILSLSFGLVLFQLLVERFSLSVPLAGIVTVFVSVFLHFIGIYFIALNSKLSDVFKSLMPLFPLVFWLIVFSKLIIGSLAGSHYLVQGFIPFIDFFVTHFQNPYEHFASLGQSSFPYPAGMLLYESLPALLLNKLLPTGVLPIQLLLSRLPLLFADVLIYLVLCNWLPGKERKVLWLYFASPIVFYISYFHGQLDVIPTAALLCSLWLLFKNKFLPAWFVLGFGVATKTHLLIAVPFYIVYAWRNKVDVHQLVRGVVSALFIFILLNAPFISRGFVGMVFNNPEQDRLFALNIQFGLPGLYFYFAPAFLLFIFFVFYRYRRLNPDALLLSLGLVFTVLIALVPPMQGWFYWSLPFLVFFVIKFKETPGWTMWVLSGLYLLYFIFVSNSDAFESLFFLYPPLTQWVSPYTVLVLKGLPASQVSSGLFTVLETFLVTQAIWVSQKARETIELFQKKKRHFIFGIAGDSGVGKSTLLSVLEKVVGSHNLVTLNGDDMHKWERGDQRWDFVTHLNPKGNFMHTDLEHALRLLEGSAIERRAYDHGTGRFTNEKRLDPNKFIVFQGLMPFFLDRMRELYDLKIYVEAQDVIRAEWKMTRDQGERGYTRERVIQQIADRKHDAARFVHPQRVFADWIISHEKDGKGVIYTAYFIRNSFEVERVIEALQKCSDFEITHEYHDVEYQRVQVNGSISKEEIEAVAYELYPNLFDIIENKPLFESGLFGVHQLMFICLLENYYRLHIRHA